MYWFSSCLSPRCLWVIASLLQLNWTVGVSQCLWPVCYTLTSGRQHHWVLLHHTSALSSAASDTAGPHCTLINHFEVFIDLILLFLKKWNNKDIVTCKYYSVISIILLDIYFSNCFQVHLWHIWCLQDATPNKKHMCCQTQRWCGIVFMLLICIAVIQIGWAKHVVKWSQLRVHLH